MRQILVAAVVSLLLSLIVTPLVIRYFRKRGFGQMIREGENMPAHEAKQGTPTMGGTAIVLAALGGWLAARLAGVDVTAKGLVVLFTFVGMGIVGFVDDFIKLRMQRNLGLSKTSKFVGQALVAGLFAYLGTQFGGITRELSFVREIGIVLPAVVFLVWVFLLLSGTSNAVNLTDGLDGLAAGASTMIFGAYTFIAFWQVRHPTDYAIDPSSGIDVAVIAAAAMAATAGFLWFNAPPAQIFMGDTGSLAIGGLLAALAMTTKTEFLLAVLGGIFVIETLSVMAQVFSYRLLGRRVLRMAPLHHHFEVGGWDEITVLVRFWLIAGLSVALGLGLFYAEFLARGGGGG